LLIIAALLVILATMYFSFGSSNRQESRKKLCHQNLQKIYLALQVYANDHTGRFPAKPGARTSEEALDVLVPRYTSDTSVFICPGSKDSSLPAGESFRTRRISYAYYMGRSSADSSELLMSDKQIGAQRKTAGQIVFSITGKPPGNNHHKDGGNFLFCDGRVESSSTEAPFPPALTRGVELLNPKP
jgi:prepilin-type processing-associated H-X9-DG protein